MESNHADIATTGNCRNSLTTSKLNDQKHRRVNTESIMRLKLDAEMINNENDPYYKFDENTSKQHDDVLQGNSPLSQIVFRQEGISIGCNYLRIDGETYTRDHFKSQNLTIHETIGHGAFSTVYRATAKQWLPSYPPTTSSDEYNEAKVVYREQDINVAIKVWSVNDLSSTKRLNMLLKELRTLGASCRCTLSLVQLHGAFINISDDYENNKSVSIVLEFMNRGSLHQFIQGYSNQNNIDNPLSYRCDHILNGLPESIIAPILYQILLGLQVLHERRIVHRDLKPANVLVNSDGYVKLCDFGISSAQSTDHDRRGKMPLMEDSTVMNHTVLGTTKFMSPERLRAQTYSRSSDVWSFGCILYQCCTNNTIWDGINNIVDLVMTIEETKISDILKQLHATRFPMCSEGSNEEDTVKEGTGRQISHGLQEIVVGCLQIDSSKRIPAKLLLQSPWFSRAQNIHMHADAIQRIKAFIVKRL